MWWVVAFIWLESFGDVSWAAPPVNTVKMDVAAFSANLKLYDLQDQLKAEGHAMAPPCRRFLDLSTQLTTEIQNGLTRFIKTSQKFENPNDEEFQFLNRLQIAISAFFEMDLLLRKNAEGGYGTLDLSMTTACPFKNRKQLVSSFKETLALLQNFFQAAYGEPTYKKMDADQRRLLRLMAQQEANDEKKSWMVLAGGTAFSIAFWQFGAPAVGATIRGLWGYSPKLITIPTFIFGVKASAMTAEAAAIAYADHIVSSNIPPPENKFGSWDEHMDAIDLFAQSPQNSPDLQYILMSRIHAQFLPIAAKTLRTYEFIEMLQIVAGATVDQQLRQLPAWMEDKFRYHPRCSRSWIGGLSDTECLIGVRTLARALLNEDAPSPPETIIVKISKKGDWQAPDMAARVATFTIPFSAHPLEIENFLKTEFSKINYSRRLKMIERVDLNQSQLESLTRQSFEIDDSVENDRAANSLYKLFLLAQEDPEIFKGSTEVFRLSNQFRLPYERNLKLKEDLNVDANAEALRHYLRNRTNQSYQPRDLPTYTELFFRERAQLDEQKMSLIATAKIGKIECESTGTLLLDECKRALYKLARVLKMPRLNLPKVDLVIVLPSDGMPAKIDFYHDRREKRSILLLRSNFSFIDFIQYSDAQHWLRAREDKT